MSGRPVVVAGALLLFSVAGPGCAERRHEWPFPRLGPLPVERGLEALLARSRAVRTLSALLRVALDAEDLSGTLDLACVFRRPGDLHLAAYHGILIASRPVFELTVSGGRYRLVLHGREGPPEVSAGASSDFPRDHPEMAGLFWIREALFLPGEVDGDGMTLDGQPAADGTFVARGRLRNGARVVWTIEPETFAVVGADVSPPAGEALHIDYLDYHQSDGVIVPSRVEAHGADGRFGMLAVVRDIEVNGDVPADVFDTGAEGR